MGKAPGAHSILSASGCERWWNCPGSVKAVEGYENKESIHAAKGTVAHGLAADTLEHEWSYQKLASKVGETVMQGEFEIEIDEEMIDHVWYFVELVYGELEEGCELRIEQRVDLEKVNKHFFGTADVVIVKPFYWIKVIDFKYGKGIKVDAYKNKQGMYYLTCAWEGEDVMQGEVIICQPRVAGEKVTRYQVSYGEYQTFRSDLAKNAKRALGKNPKRVAGQWCKKTFCPAFVDCPTAGQLVRDIVVKDFQDEPTPPEKLKMSQIQLVLEKADLITGWVNAVKDHAKGLMIHGENIPGYKLVQAYGHRTWQSEESVIADLEPE